MAVNKVVFGDRTVVDLTGDSVTTDTMLEGVTAHDRSGAQITGTAVIPTVNNGKLTIQKNGTTVATFTANQSAAATANITVPVKVSDLTNDSNFVADSPTFTEASSRANIASGETFATILGKIKKFFTDLKAVAFSGSYNDLSDKPTIPTVNNATLTIQKNGTTVKTFTANASSNVTANITVPTKVSELTNDSEYVTTDTKNTAGSTNTSSKIFLVGATSQAANPQTYSHDTAYVGTDGCLYSDSTKVLTVKTGGGVGQAPSTGSTSSWIDVATLTVASTYANHPIMFEISERYGHYTRLEVLFKNANNKDPDLDTFTSDGNTRFYIKKIDTSTWKIYYIHTTYVTLTIHRITGEGLNYVTVTPNLTVLTEAPTDVIQVTNGWSAAYADNAGTVNGKTVAVNVPADAVFTDTKNTAGSTDSSSKLFLIGATSQAANPQTYSHDTAYVGTDGCLYSGGTKVLTAHQDISGKVNKSGDTMTNTLTIQRTSTNEQNYPSSLNLWTVDSTNSVTSKAAISAYDGGASGANMVINPNGNLFVGSGEGPYNHYSLYKHSTGEVLYMTSDNQVHIQSNGQTIANRHGLMIDNSGNVLPEKADVATNNSGSIGTSSYKWADGYFTNINGVAVGNSPKFTDTTYSAGSNITLSGTEFSLTKANVTGALGYTPPTTDTKNTAGSTNTSSKIFLIGATSQAANPQTYSQDTAYVGTDGCLYSGGAKVLTSHQSIAGKVDKKTTLDTYYGTCSTAAATAAKVITVTDDATNFSLRAGITIVVKFTATNTAANPTFNVNSTGAKSVWYNTYVIETTSLGYAGTANRPMMFTYDGTRWIFVGWSYDANTTYSAMSVSELTTGTATTSRVVRADYLNTGIKAIALPLSGGVMTGPINLHNEGSLINSSGAASSATTFVKGSAFLNLCSPGIQCRNFADNGWAGITGTSFTPQNNSSRKIKENIKPITEEEAQKLLEVNVVSFDYKQGAGFGDGDERKGKFGVIAEEINEIIPSVVSYQINDDHTIDYNIPSGVSYDKFVPHLIKMVQMQQKEIDDLKKQVDYLFNSK